MIIADNKLKERELNNDPIKVGLIGAGEMAKGLLNQIMNHTPGMTVKATYSRNLDKAKEIYKVAQINDYEIVNSEQDFNNAIESNKHIITQNIDFLINCDAIDILVDMTGSIEFSTQLTLDAFNKKKDVLSFNAELDATIGPILKYKADEAGVKYSVADGDQPGVTLNLYRFVKGMGLTPLVCGNIKSILDEYRTPATQENFANSWGMSAVMATNFVDGTKVSLEQACIGNATRMRVAKRGMNGFESKEHIDNLTKFYDVDQLKEMGGVVDFVVGPSPGPGVFVYATTDDPHVIKYLDYCKLGKGPLYSFYTPYHLLFFEIPFSIARMVDFGDIILASDGGPLVEVITIAKTDLRQGDIIDGYGGFKSFGICENSDIARNENLLPIGLAGGCKVLRDIPKDQALTFDDVELPEGRLCDELWNEQRNFQFPTS